MITTRVTSPPGFEPTAAEVIAGIGLYGRPALVTAADILGGAAPCWSRPLRRAQPAEGTSRGVWIA
jgi:hypothetical protein